MPNETAKAHRHTAFAMRFIIEGQGGFTAVHGRRVRMQRGDVILTPTWNWHDHGKDGSGPMIWLDGLDLPNFRHFPVHFVEHYREARYPAQDVDSNDSPIVFPWAKMKESLDSIPGNWATRDYLGRDGRPVSRVLGGSAERLAAGSSSPAVQETSSSVYHIVSGKGHSIVGETTIDWEAGDTFCVPSWHRYQHFADGKETVYLYRFHDKPMLNALGFYRAEGVDVESLVFIGYPSVVHSVIRSLEIVVLLCSAASERRMTS
ncbi:RmlC-like cupin [Thozetella sp. PMI_491]|nr:RmlC-like cupin [Thozetella sp. PMI_491]